ncbi:MAG: serine hydrolase [Anaerolineae bacterium]
MRSQYRVMMIGLLLCVLTVLPTAAQEKVFFPTTEWRTSTPEEQGMNSAELASLFENFSQKEFNLDSLMVVRHGYVVAEAYASPFQQDMKHQMYSASKSVTSALIGILLQQGTIKSLETPVLSFFPDMTVQNLDENKKAMTLGNLISMSSGLDCDDLATANATTNSMFSSKDWLQFTLDLPMASKPGTEFHYCNPATYLTSAIVTKLTDMSALDFAAKSLFKPLGITDYAWASSPQGISFGFADLQLTARDMAKFGYLYLNGGQWDGVQLIPADFVTASLHPVVSTPWPSTSYGYFWWTNDDLGQAQALGWGGQYILVSPAQDTVAVLTGGYTENIRVATHVFPFQMQIASLSVSEKALPANSDALDQLVNVINRIENPTSVAVRPAPVVASKVTNQAYNLMSPFMMSAFGASGMLNAKPVTGMRFDFSDDKQTKLTFTFADGQEWTASADMSGVYKVTEGPFGPLGIRGEWLSDDTFCLFMKNVGDAQLNRLEVSFVPGAVNVIGGEYVGGWAFALQGLAAQ